MSQECSVFETLNSLGASSFSTVQNQNQLVVDYSGQLELVIVFLKSLDSYPLLSKNRNFWCVFFASSTHSWVHFISAITFFL